MRAIEYRVQGRCIRDHRDDDVTVADALGGRAASRRPYQAASGAGAISHLPYDTVPNWGSPYLPEHQNDINLAGVADARAVTPGYFEATGARLIEGRWFSEADTFTSPRVAIVDSMLAARLWPGASAIGRRIKADPDTTGFPSVTLTVVDRGPGHWPGSAVPGQLGNAVFAGHRVTHSHPFRHVDKLVPGDEIIFVMPNGTFIYRMTKQEIVKPTDTWIVNPTQDATLTLFACHPPGSAAKRIVIRGVFSSRA